MFKVTNKNDFDFSARYDGKNYVFPAGETRSCPDAAVIHIFGLADTDKTAIVARHGWAKVTEPLSVGLEKLKKFIFEQLKPQYEHPMASEGYGPAPVVSGTDAVKGSDGSETASGTRKGIMHTQKPA